MQNKKADYKDNPVIAAVILFIIALAVTAAMAGANEITKDTIAMQIKIEQDNARLEVFPEAVSFEDISADYISVDTPKISSAYKVFDKDSEFAGLVVVSSAKGYGGDVTIMSGISLEKKVLGIKVLSENETPGLGKKVAEKSFTQRFLNKPPGRLFTVKKADSNVNSIDAITGVTISSKAMVDALNEALDFASAIYPELNQGGGK